MDYQQSTSDVQHIAPPLKRAAIIGTAQSWRDCPWDDQTLEVWGLNDAYMIGVPRANRWYELHPFSQMHFRDAKERDIKESSIPLGAYIRPAGHLDWLKAQPFPTYLLQAQPDHPRSWTFPKDEILAWWAPYWPWRLTKSRTIVPGPDYEVSTPSWMLMHALMEGYREIHVYGIHLATEWEYVEQRPNFEWLLGIAGGIGAKIVLPESTPICKAHYRYAFEPKADLPIQALQRKIVAIKQEGLTLRQQLGKLKWWAGHAGERADLEARLKHLDVELADTRGQLTRVQTQLAS